VTDEVTVEEGDVSRADFDGSKIPFDPSTLFFSVASHCSVSFLPVFVFYFSTDKTPRPTGYSLTVDDIARRAST